MKSLIQQYNQARPPQVIRTISFAILVALLNAGCQTAPKPLPLSNKYGSIYLTTGTTASTSIGKCIADFQSDGQPTNIISCGPLNKFIVKPSEQEVKTANNHEFGAFKLDGNVIGVANIFAGDVLYAFESLEIKHYASSWIDDIKGLSDADLESAKDECSRPNIKAIIVGEHWGCANIASDTTANVSLKFFGVNYLESNGKKIGAPKYSSKPGQDSPQQITDCGTLVPIRIDVVSLNSACQVPINSFYVNRLLSNNKDFQRDLDTQNGKLAEARSSLDKREKELQELQRELGAMTAHTSQDRQTIEKLQSRITSLSEGNDALKSQLDAIKNTNIATSQGLQENNKNLQNANEVIAVDAARKQNTEAR